MGSFGLVVSLITLQHMVPPLQVAYLEQLCEALAPGGVGYVDVGVALADPVANPPFECGEFGSHARRGGMQLHALDAQEAVSHLEAAGCTVVTTLHNNFLGAAGQSSQLLFTKAE